MNWLQDWVNGLNIVLVIMLFLVGIVLIVKGGDCFVDAASWMAEVTGIPKLIVGATVVSLATTLPELLVSVFATIQGDVGMATGNAIGSVTANLGLIMGISLFCIPSAVKRKDYIVKSALMLLPLIVMFVFCFRGLTDSTLGIAASICLGVIFVVNVYDNIRGAKKQMLLEKEIITTNSSVNVEIKEKPTSKTIIINILKFVLGALAIVAGAQLLVSTATRIASGLGVSDTIIGLTIVAVGTSLPELVTTITAIIKKESSLSVGNIIGANIIDLTLILSICSFISGGNLLMYEQNIIFDIPVCFIEGLIALIPMLITGKFRRWQGVLMLVVYVAYLTFLIVGLGVIGITPAT